jgi:hypothetical protein
MSGSFGIIEEARHKRGWRVEDAMRPPVLGGEKAAIEPSDFGNCRGERQRSKVSSEGFGIRRDGSIEVQERAGIWRGWNRWGAGIVPGKTVPPARGDTMGDGACKTERQGGDRLR